MRHVSPALPAVLVFVALSSISAITFFAERFSSLQEDARTAELTRAMGRVVAGRRDAVDDLLKGKANLAETAARFRHLAADDPNNIFRWLRQEFPTASCEEELHFRHVLLFAEARHKETARNESAVAEIRKEMSEREMDERWTLD
jgi:hypothetical protein